MEKLKLLLETIKNEDKQFSKSSYFRITAKDVDGFVEIDLSAIPHLLRFAGEVKATKAEIEKYVNQLDAITAQFINSMEQANVETP